MSQAATVNQQRFHGPLPIQVTQVTGMVTGITALVTGMVTGNL